MNVNSSRTESASTASADTVEVGEITIQFTAHGEPAAEELAALRETLREEVGGLEEANAVVEMYSLPDFDARLSWGQNRDGEARQGERHD